MSESYKAWFRYIFLTLGCVISLALLLISWSLYPNWVGFIVIALVFYLVVRYTSVWQCYFTPIVKAELFSRVDADTQTRFVVEQALLNSGRIYLPTVVLRFSLYQVSTGQRLRRVLIGDSADWLGVQGNIAWFRNRSRFYNRRTGKLGYHLTTGKLINHESIS